MSSTTIDLNGPWQFRSSKESGKFLPATVPGCVHADLRANDKIPDPFWGSNELELDWIEKTDWEYQRVFVIAAELLDHDYIELVADGLDTVATIAINNQAVGSTENMFIGWRFDIKPLLKQGRNTIRIVFANPTDYIAARRQPTDFGEWNDPVGGAALMRKMQCSFGWDWGPRFATSGIYRSISIRAFDHERIESVLVEQTHEKGRVALKCTPSLAHGDGQGLEWRCTLARNGKIIDRTQRLTLSVSKPELWWPNGLGDHPLYDLTVELLDGGEIVDTWRHRIGLRTIRLDTHADQWGQSFQFLVNGMPVFAKGANWVPAHSFVSGISRADYDSLLSDSAAVHMNMIRVWGGGIYEADDFYDLCDEKGLLVWQDFMFACAQYPGTPGFLGSVRDEAEFQIKRIRNHACLALWCGSNEIEDMIREITKTPERRKAFEDLFYSVIPSAVERHSPGIPFWPSSPHNVAGWDKPRDIEGSGDVHNWEVWHQHKPVSGYLDHDYRFVSEYGMQAYCSLETARQFAPESQMNIFGPTMENHQKNSAGNGLIFEYISHRYRFPRDLASLIYLSQINQAYSIQTAVDHHRRTMPRTMGSLYWQLNDCWPVASWSSIEFGGRWRAMHYAARRFFAPVTVTGKLIGKESVGRINRQLNTVEGVEVYTVSDSVKPLAAKLCWTLYHLNGKSLQKGSLPVTLAYGESTMHKSLTFAKEFKTFGKASLFLHLYLAAESSIVAQNTVFFTAPRLMELPCEKLSPLIKKLGPQTFKLVFKAKTFQHCVYCNLAAATYRASDNFFDLYPGLPYSVTVDTEKPMETAAFKKRLEIMSLADSY